MQVVAKQNGAIKTKIATWAKEKGLLYSIAHTLNQEVPFSFKMADKIVFSKVKENLGLD